MFKIDIKRKVYLEASHNPKKLINVIKRTPKIPSLFIYIKKNAKRTSCKFEETGKVCYRKRKPQNLTVIVRKETVACGTAIYIYIYIYTWVG